MEKARKNLKISSVFVLLFALFYLIQALAELMFGEVAGLEEPENVVRVTKIFIAVVAVLLTLPKIYVGIRGMRIAKNPVATRGHMVWAVIIFVFSALGLIEPIAGYFQQGNAYENTTALCSVLLEMAVYVEYFVYARAVWIGCGKKA